MTPLPLPSHRVYFDNVFRHKGLSRVIISDRDPRFTSNFWRTLFRLLGTKLSFSTAFHPQTDGQTERVNRVIEEALRPYVNARHSDWDLYLTPIEFRLQQLGTASPPVTPPSTSTPVDTLSHLRPPQTTFLRYPRRRPIPHNIATSLHDAKTLLVLAQNRQKQYADQRRRPLTFQPGDQVYLATAHMLLPTRDLPSSQTCTQIHRALHYTTNHLRRCVQTRPTRPHGYPPRIPRIPA